MAGNILLEKIKQTFKDTFGEEPIIVRSPGRINLIGEHTDYNKGYVLPAAIDKAIYFAFSARNDEKIELVSLDFGDTHSSDAEVLVKTGKWSDYILGVVDQFKKHNYKIKGFNCVFGGDIPLGAGLSSSAALENGIGFGLNHLFQLHIEPIELVKLSQKAENQFVGVQCGIMDQFASMMGQKDKVIQLDCDSLNYKYEPIVLEGMKILLLNTNVHHSLASSEYNTRRQQCEAGVKLLRDNGLDIDSLRDATMEMLDQYVKPVDDIIYSRCKYVVEEKERLLEGCKDLERGDVAAFGKKMFRTHEGLSKEYEVSCPELDYLVDIVKDNPNVLGARMMGGGFGGCTINIVREDAIESLVVSLKPQYRAHTGLDLDYYVAVISDGTSLIND
ncbi:MULTISPECIES: galactokinase [Chitinophagaceae]